MNMYRVTGPWPAPEPRYQLIDDHDDGFGIQGYDTKQELEDELEALNPEGCIVQWDLKLPT